MLNRGDGKSLEVTVQFSWYGTTSKRDKSGAYLFLPDGEAKVRADARGGDWARTERVVRSVLNASQCDGRLLGIDELAPLIYHYWHLAISSWVLGEQ